MKTPYYKHKQLEVNIEDLYDIITAPSKFQKDWESKKMRTSPQDPSHLVLKSRLMQKFYRKIAGLPILPSDSPYNLTISHTKKFIWFRVAKVATRTIYHHLLDQKVPLELQHPYRVHYPVNRYREYFKFAFVRNPWERLVSGWHNKFKEKNQPPFGLDATVHKKLQDFDYFIQHLGESEFIGRNHHFVPQCDLIDLNHLDYLGKMEQFSDDFKQICRHIGIEADNVGYKNSSGRDKDYRSYYTDNLAEIVRNLYIKDIQFFAYNF